ncbi:MAG: transcription termination/antitermination protein NusA [Treponema sp. CETP13]|nr:MAG: transcription termination/antitermination protein NusA [Treponema sp. CETP13]
MASEMAEAIRQLTQDNGISEDSIISTIESTIKAAYKRKFGSSENCIVHFADDLSDVSVYSRKVIVDGVYDPVTEIELEDALKMSEECELGDEIDILIDPKNFDRSAVQTGKQTAHQFLSESHKDSLMAQYKDKVGEIIIGYYQRERNGNIYVDLGKVEGILPARYQSPRETYHKSDRIKALVVDVKKTSNGLQLVLSRTDPDFVRAIIELEVPEVYDKIIDIHKIVREAGYRTKIAVSSNREDVDPVGACVGLKGVRIQSIIRELEGEKIDILKWDEDYRSFIKNALSPAQVSGVVILDEEKRQALAVVPDDQLSLAIGKQGLNVRLANRLVDWNIDIKTEAQYEDYDQVLQQSRESVANLFNDDVDNEVLEIQNVSEIPGVDSRIANLLAENNILDIQSFMNAAENGSLTMIEGLSEEDIQNVSQLIDHTVEFVENDVETNNDESSVDTESEKTTEEEQKTDTESVQEESDTEVYECPECGAPVTIDMTECPKCHIGLSFEFEDEE